MEDGKILIYFLAFLFILLLLGGCKWQRMPDRYYEPNIATNYNDKVNNDKAQRREVSIPYTVHQS